MFRSFFTTIFRGSSAVLCAVTIPPAVLRSLSLYYYAVCDRMCMSSVCVWCPCLLVICLFTSKSSTDKTNSRQLWVKEYHILSRSVIQNAIIVFTDIDYDLYFLWRILTAWHEAYFSTFQCDSCIQIKAFEKPEYKERF
jgi:hypothetical protein